MAKKITSEMVAEIVAYYDANRCSFADLGKKFGIGKSTAERTVKRNRRNAASVDPGIEEEFEETLRTRGMKAAAGVLMKQNLRSALREAASGGDPRATAAAFKAIADGASRLDDAEDLVNPESGLPGPSVVIEITGGGACLVIATGTRLEAVRHALALCEKFQIDSAVPAIKATIAEEQNQTN